MAQVGIRYRVLPEQAFHPDLGAYQSYAIICEERAPDEDWHVSCKVSDVTDSSSAAAELARLFNEGKLAPCHLYAVIENWLNR